MLTFPHPQLRLPRSQLKKWYQYIWGIPIAKLTAHFNQADISIFHQFRPAPTGGGHQFMRALRDQFIRMGLRVENNTISHTTRVCLFNSHNFDFDRLLQLQRAGCRMVHRVDGPIDVYRGQEGGADRRIWQINQELADATIFQSNYSLQKHIELGLTFRSPSVIMNAVDPQIFHSKERIPFDRQRKIRLISSSWSDNPNKGSTVYKWLEKHLDWGRFEYTFVGRSPIQFKRIQMLSPVISQEMAPLLQQHDIYITASKYEACSNALIEALSCSLPVIYVRSGSNGEIVGKAGFGFTRKEEILPLLDQLVDEYEYRQAQIALPNLAEVAHQYLTIMEINNL